MFPTPTAADSLSWGDQHLHRGPLVTMQLSSPPYTPLAVVAVVAQWATHSCLRGRLTLNVNVQPPATCRENPSRQEALTDFHLLRLALGRADVVGSHAVVLPGVLLAHGAEHLLGTRRGDGRPVR